MRASVDECGTSGWFRVSILNTAHDEQEYHRDTELFYLLEGSMTIEVSGRSSKLNSDDILVVNADEPYRYEALDDPLYAKISLATSVITYTMQSADVIFWCDSTQRESDRYDELRKVLRRLLRRYLSQRKGVANFGYYAQCYEVLDLLTTHYLLRVTDREATGETERYDDRIVEINRFVHANYASPISTKDLAQKLYLSQGYLSRFFKRNYGMSFGDYLTEIRLYHALDDLRYTDKTIARVAYDNGFTNATSFYKAFKDRYETTPSEMRTRFQKQESEVKANEDAALAEGRLEKFLRTEGIQADSSTEQSHVESICDVNSNKPLSASWSSTINIGAAADLLRSDMRDHALLLAKEFGFTHVRFWNIFAPELLIDTSKAQGEYNFTRLDEILDFLVDHNLAPHIELGVKPRRLYRTVQDALVLETSKPPFATLRAWKAFLGELLEHFRRRYDSETLATWRIELWFDEAQWGDEAAASRYCEAFTATYRLIKSYASNLEVGGCGLRLVSIEDNDTCLAFLTRWSQEPVRPDFISNLYYGYESGEILQDKYAKRTTDNDALLHRVDYLIGMLKSVGLSDSKLYLTEWNLTVSDRNYINDSCFKGAYIVKNLIDTYGLMDLTSYFMGSDRYSEHYDSRGLLHGGSGLVSKDGIVKPAGYAFKFFSWLYSRFVGRGANYLISTDSDGSLGIICHNQKVLNYSYYLSQEDEVERDAIWEYFEDLDPLHLDLTLTGIISGCYQIKSYVINEEHGDPLTAWKELDYETELTADDLRYFALECRPKMTIITAEATSQALQLDITLAPNEIRFIRISPVRHHQIQDEV